MATNDTNPEPETTCQGTWREVYLPDLQVGTWQLMKCSGCGEYWAIFHGSFPQFSTHIEPTCDPVSALIHADLEMAMAS